MYAHLMGIIKTEQTNKESDTPEGNAFYAKQENKIIVNQEFKSKTAPLNQNQNSTKEQNWKSNSKSQGHDTAGN